MKTKFTTISSKLLVFQAFFKPSKSQIEKESKDFFYVNNKEKKQIKLLYK